MQHRDHYAGLDGLRGLAAVSVLLFHLGHWYGQGWLAANAGLAVDFFFCLSGYVLSLAYRSRLDAGHTTLAFFQARAVRLLPLIIAGTLISGTYLVARVILLHDQAISLPEVALAIGLGMACLPTLTASRAIGGPQVFPLNGPQYTLFLELVVNVVWAATRRIEGLWTALVITLVGYLFMALYGLGGDDVATFWTGFPRVFGAFYAGVAVFHGQRRYEALANPRWSTVFVPLFVLSFVLFYWPMPLPAAVKWSWSLFASPMLVLSGSKVVLAGVTRRIALLLGELSYPVYALHYPIFVWVNAGYQEVVGHRDIVTCSLVVVAVVLMGSTAMLKLFDKPVRAWITARLRKRPPSAV